MRRPWKRLAVAGNRVAVAYADRAEHQIAVLGSAQTVRVLDLSGHTVSTITVGLRPRSVAIAPPYVALLLGNRISLYRYDTPVGMPYDISDPHFTGAALDAAGTLVVGRSGHTVAWAENVRSGGRIRVMQVGPPST